METEAASSPAPRQSPLVSIIIVNYNGAELLSGCLSSLRQISWSNREIIVVDNGSADNSREVISSFPEVELVPSAVNLGFAGGNNLGLKHARGEYVLLLNNDTVVTSGFLNPLCSYLEANPNVGIVQGKMILPRFGNRLDVCGSFLTSVGFPYHYGYYKPDGPKYNRAYAVFSGKGACLMFRRDLIDRVGGFLFDEGFFCYYEESDFCHRAWIAGYEVHFVSSPPIAHLMGATSGDSHTEFVLRHYLRNMTFSLLANLSETSRVRILLPFFAMLITSTFAAGLRGRKGQFLAHWGALVHSFRCRDKIRERRKLVASIRKQSDQAIFAKVLRTPKPGYFFKTFTGKLSEYEDD